MAGPADLRGVIDALLGDVMHPEILGHSHRVHALANAEAQHRGWAIDTAELIVASLFHDSGTIDDQSAERFEVAGADRAVAFARSVLGAGEAACGRIWLAVALHTSPGIAERAHPLTRAVRAGVTADFADPELRRRHAELIRDIEQRHPRGAIESTLARGVVEAALRRPGKAPPASWPADLVRGHHASPRSSVNPNF